METSKARKFPVAPRCEWARAGGQVTKRNVGGAHVGGGGGETARRTSMPKWSARTPERRQRSSNASWSEKSKRGYWMWSRR